MILKKQSRDFLLTRSEVGVGWLSSVVSQVAWSGKELGMGYQFWKPTDIGGTCEKKHKYCNFHG